MLKVLIVKNRFTKNFDYKPAFDWFEERTPLRFDVKELDTDFDLEFTSYSNATFKGCGVTNIKDKLKTVIPPDYNVVIFIYGNKAKCIKVSVTNKTPLYPNTEFIQLAKPDWKTLNHEIFHALFNILERKGIKLDDPMDKVEVKGKIIPYYNDKNIKASESNRTIALERLKPYWNAVENKGAVRAMLKRTVDNGIQTLGELTISGYKFCTLELSYKDNKSNISCIPAGTYTCKYTFSPRFMRSTYEILGVPNRAGIRIHSGNHWFQIQGCILLGEAFSDINKDGQLDVVQSKDAIKRFESLVKKEPFVLAISPVK